MVFDTRIIIYFTQTDAMHRNIHLLLRINGLFAIMDSVVIHSQVLMASVIFSLKVLQGVEHEVIISTIKIIIGI